MSDDITRSPASGAGPIVGTAAGMAMALCPPRGGGGRLGEPGGGRGGDSGLTAGWQYATSRPPGNPDRGQDRAGRLRAALRWADAMATKSAPTAWSRMTGAARYRPRQLWQVP